MMSANPEVEKLVSAWWAIPNKLLAGWQATVQDGLSAPWTRAYGRSIDVMESFTLAGLRIPADWCKLTIGSVRSGSGEAAGVGQWGGQVENMVNYCSDTAQQLASTWFQMIRELRPLSWSGLPARDSQAMTVNAAGLQVLQNLVRNSLEMQRAWASLVMPGGAADAPEAKLQETVREQQERTAAPRKTLETDQAA